MNVLHLSITVLVVGIAGCASLQQAVTTGSAAPRSPMVAAPTGYVGGDCAKIAASASPSAVTGSSRSIVTRLCPHEARINEVALLHRGFDDRRPNQVTAALIAFDGARLEHEWAPLGMSTYYAELLDETQLRAQLDRSNADLSTDARDAFQRAAMDAKSVVLARAARLDARRTRAFIETPHKVIAKRAEHFKSHTAEFQKLDAALASKAAASQGLAALRSDYFAKCADDSCRFDPLPMEITRSLASSESGLVAQAENSVLREAAADRRSFAGEIGVAVNEVLAEDAKANAGKSLVASGGADWLGNSSAATSVQDARVEAGVVRAITIAKRGGSLAEVRFREDATPEASDAKPASASILIPIDEAKRIHPGETLVVVVAPDSRQGEVIASYAAAQHAAKTKAPIVQLRGDRIGAQQAPPQLQEEAGPKSKASGAPRMDGVKAKRRSGK